MDFPNPKTAARRPKVTERESVDPYNESGLLTVAAYRHFDCAISQRVIGFAHKTDYPFGIPVSGQLGRPREALRELRLLPTSVINGKGEGRQLGDRLLTSRPKR